MEENPIKKWEVPSLSKLYKTYALVGGMLEVVTEDLERYFFCYQSGMFVEKIFKKIEILEGEQELAKQLDLFVGQE